MKNLFLFLAVVFLFTGCSKSALDDKDFSELAPKPIICPNISRYFFAAWQLTHREQSPTASATATDTTNWVAIKDGYTLSISQNGVFTTSKHATDYPNCSTGTYEVDFGYKDNILFELYTFTFNCDKSGFKKNQPYYFEYQSDPNDKCKITAFIIEPVDCTGCKERLSFVETNYKQ